VITHFGRFDPFAKPWANDRYLRNAATGVDVNRPSSNHTRRLAIRASVSLRAAPVVLYISQLVGRISCAVSFEASSIATCFVWTWNTRRSKVKRAVKITSGGRQRSDCLRAFR
jgi:hypothetical protein